MFFSTNVKLLRNRRQRTQDEVAHALGMKRSTLSGYENEVAKPGVEVLLQFSDYYGISIDTLIRVDLSTLSENMLSQIERGLDVYSRGGKLRVLATTVNSQNVENIELVPEKAKAGYSRGFADTTYIENLPVFNLPFLPDGKKYRTFQLQGDSMLPIPHGAWVTGEYVVDWTLISNLQACIVCTLDEGLVFKLVENNLSKNGEFVLHSLNPEYKPYSIKVSSITEVWRFVNFISHQMPATVNVTAEVLERIKVLQTDITDIKQRIG